MIVNDDFLLTAGEIAVGKREIDYRNAISRAYYFAYHEGSKYQHLCPGIAHLVIRGGYHERLIQRYLQFTANDKAVALGYVLQDMRNKREAADYYLSDNVNARDAQIQIKTARTLQSRFASFFDASSVPHKSA